MRSGALLRAARARRRAVSGSEGRGPQDLGQKELRAIWRQMAAVGMSREERRWRWRERQSGKPGPTGRPEDRTARRSGGKAKLNSASTRANSASERPGLTGMPELRRWQMTFSEMEEKERRPSRMGSEAAAVVAVAARAERRRSPATWAGFRPAIRRSTSTMVVVVEERGNSKDEVFFCFGVVGLVWFCVLFLTFSFESVWE